MTREEVYRDMEGTLGLVPTMFKTLPEEALEFEWRLFKQVQVNEEVIPAKYRELIGLAAGAALGDKYCVVAHRELAKACGATDEEIEGAIRLAKGVAGWGTYMTGLDFSLETLRTEIGQVCDFIRSGELARGGKVAAERAGVPTH
jgi:AhpD family alkylhydroperoxidase